MPDESVESASNFAVTSNSELLEMLKDAEQTVKELDAELELRREKAEQGIREAEQHREIERLEEHLAEATVQWREVRDFLRELLREMRERSNPEPEQTRTAE